MSDPVDSEALVTEGEAPAGMRCDFCGKSVSQVRRVALDRDYERLQTPHPVRYACAECSAAKEQERRREPGSA